jgi:two-component system, chemotaxis family, response regulator Rcp1
MSGPVHVLVVDDNPGFLRAARAILENEFTVHTVENGTAALAFLGRQTPFGDAPRPSFIVLDFHLPDMSAPAVLARLGDDMTLRSIPVLVLSQADWEEDQAAARAAGARAFRVKPSRVQALREAVIDFWKEHGDASPDPARRG